jgi:N-acetylneuraminic acid mutarotase
MRTTLGAVAVVLLAVSLAAVLGARGPGPAEAEAAPWTFAQSMSQRRSYVAAALAGGEIYAAGGMVGETGRFLDVFQRYDPQTDTWTTLDRLPEPVRAGAGAALDGKIYVIGGQVQEGSGRQVFAYDVAARRWQERAPLPEPRFNVAAVALGGKVYALGGFGGEREHSDVFVYDPASDSWSAGTRLPRANHTFGAVVFRGEIWVLGGRRGENILREVWIYDPRTRRWRAGPTMPRAMELVGAAVVGDQIHAIWEDVYQIYDASTGRWTQGPRSLVTRHGLKTFYADGALYTVGGCTTDLQDSQVVEMRSLGGARSASQAAAAGTRREPAEVGAQAPRRRAQKPPTRS